MITPRTIENHLVLKRQSRLYQSINFVTSLRSFQNFHVNCLPYLLFLKKAAKFELIINGALRVNVPLSLGVKIFEKAFIVVRQTQVFQENVRLKG